MTSKNIDLNGRPDYPPITDLQPYVDEKIAALNAKLADMDKQQAETLATYVNSSKPAAKPKADPK